MRYSYPATILKNGKTGLRQPVTIESFLADRQKRLLAGLSAYLVRNGPVMAGPFLRASSGLHVQHDMTEGLIGFRPARADVGFFSADITCAQNGRSPLSTVGSCSVPSRCSIKRTEHFALPEAGWSMLAKIAAGSAPDSVRHWPG